MAIAARFHDGLVAEVEAVELEYQAIGAVGTLVIRRSGDGAELGRWPANTLYALHGRRDELRLGANGQPAGARVVVS